jgi:hypothetical protein
MTGTSPPLNHLFSLSATTLHCLFHLTQTITPNNLQFWHKNLTTSQHMLLHSGPHYYYFCLSFGGYCFTGQKCEGGMLLRRASFWDTMKEWGREGIWLQHCCPELIKRYYIYKSLFVVLLLQNFLFPRVTSIFWQCIMEDGNQHILPTINACSSVWYIMFQFILATICFHKNEPFGYYTVHGKSKLLWEIVVIRRLG